MNPSDLDVLMRAHGWEFIFSNMPTAANYSRAYQGTQAAAPRTDVANLLMLAGLRVVRPDLTTSNRIQVFL